MPFIVREETGVIARDEYRIAVLYDPAQPWQPVGSRSAATTTSSSSRTARAATPRTSMGEAPDVLEPDRARPRLRRRCRTRSTTPGTTATSSRRPSRWSMTKEHVAERYGPIALHDRQRLLRRRARPAAGRERLPRRLPGHHAGLQLHRHRGPSAMQYEDYTLLRRYFENPTRWAPGVAWTPAQIGAGLRPPEPRATRSPTRRSSPTARPEPRRARACRRGRLRPETNPDGRALHAAGLHGQRLRRADRHGRLRRARRCGQRRHQVRPEGAAARAADAGAVRRRQHQDRRPRHRLRAAGAARSEADRPALERALPQRRRQHRPRTSTRSRSSTCAAPTRARSTTSTAPTRCASGCSASTGRPTTRCCGAARCALFGDADLRRRGDLRDGRAGWPSSRRDTPRRPAGAEDHRGARGGRGRGALHRRRRHGHPRRGVRRASSQSYSTAAHRGRHAVADDMIKCELKPLRRARLLPVHVHRRAVGALQTAFPNGVCDYTRPGTDREPTKPWQTYRGRPRRRAAGRGPALAAAGHGAAASAAAASSSGCAPRAARGRAPRGCTSTASGCGPCGCGAGGWARASTCAARAAASPACASSPGPAAAAEPSARAATASARGGAPRRARS